MKRKRPEIINRKPVAGSAHILLTSLVLLVIAGCGSGPSSSSLQEAFFSQLVAMPGVENFEVNRNVISFEYRDGDYTCTVVAIDVEPLDDEHYTHIGSIECTFTLNGEPLEHFEYLRGARLEQDALVAGWDNQHKRWRFDIEFD